MGLTEYSAFVLLSSLYNYLKTHGPKIKLQIRQIPLYGGKKLAENNEVDLAVGIRSESHELETESLFDHSLVCAARKNHPLLKSPLTVETYLKAHHLCLSKDKNCPHMTDIVLSKMGVSRKIILQVPYIVPALHILANSDLLMTFPKEIIQKSKPFLPLAMQDLPVQLPPVSYVQMWHPSHHDDEGHQWLRQAIKSVLK